MRLHLASIEYLADGPLRQIGQAGVPSRWPVLARVLRQQPRRPHRTRRDADASPRRGAPRLGSSRPVGSIGQDQCWKPLCNRVSARSVTVGYISDPVAVSDPGLEARVGKEWPPSVAVAHSAFFDKSRHWGAMQPAGWWQWVSLHLEPEIRAHLHEVSVLGCNGPQPKPAIIYLGYRVDGPSDLTFCCALMAAATFRIRWVVIATSDS